MTMDFRERLLCALDKKTGNLISYLIEYYHRNVFYSISRHRTI